MEGGFLPPLSRLIWDQHRKGLSWIELSQKQLSKGFPRDSAELEIKKSGDVFILVKIMPLLEKDSVSRASFRN